MKWHMRALASIVALVASPVVAQEVMKREPPQGSLRTGTTVLVDDGSCPRGQIKEVTGGTLGATNSTRGSGGVAMPRKRRCIPR